MTKTKFGISVGLMGAALYFMGIINIIGLVLLAGYVLLFEENEWLRRAAVKAVVIYIMFALVLAIIGAAWSPIYSLLDLIFDYNTPTSTINSVISLVEDIVSTLKVLTLGVLGIRALTQGSMAVAPADNLINKNM